MTARLRYRSPLGPIAIEATEAGVIGVSFGARGPSRPGPSARARAHLEAAAGALDAYFAGHAAPAPPLDLHGTTFQLAVWRTLQEIPWGEVRTYGEIAQALGRAGSARAVGGANHENHVAILIPCHRVVRACGRLGGYAGGLEVKRWLLAHEAAHSPALRREIPSRAPRAHGRTLPCPVRAWCVASNRPPPLPPGYPDAEAPRDDPRRR